MGGKAAQSGFHYQNMFSAYSILGSLSRKLISAKIEHVETSLNAEVDLLLEFAANEKEYYEVKSGLSFTSKKKDIMESALILFKIYQLYLNEGYSYSLIVNPSYLSTMSEVITKLKGIKEGRRQLLTKLCQDWQITEEELFRGFCIKLTIDTKFTLNDLFELCLARIDSYVKNEIISTNFFLAKEDLLNRIYMIILKSIECKDGNGNIDLKQIKYEFARWCAINKLSQESSKNDLPARLKLETSGFIRRLNRILPQIKIIAKEYENTIV